MKLKEYLIKIRMDPDEFAVKCNLGIASVYRYLNGKPARLKTARAIEKFTNFEVSVEELLGINDEK